MRGWPRRMPLAPYRRRGRRALEQHRSENHSTEAARRGDAQGRGASSDPAGVTMRARFSCARAWDPSVNVLPDLQPDRYSAFRPTVAAVGREREHTDASPDPRASAPAPAPRTAG